jgi:hypothetical protein
LLFHVCVKRWEEQMPLRLSRLWLGGVVMALPVDLHAGDRLQLLAYELGPLDVETAARTIRGFLSPAGRVVEDADHRRLIVSDRGDVHAQVAAALRQLRHSRQRATDTGE